MRHGAYGLDFQNVQIGLPSLKVEQGIVVQAETDGKALTRNGPVEHAAKCDSIAGARLDCKANDFPRKVIHHHQDPMGSEKDRFHLKEVRAPEAVFGMAQQREPRRTAFVTIGPVMGRQNPPDDVLVDLDAEGFCHPLGNPGATETEIASLEFHDGSDQLRGRPFEAGLVVPRPGVKPPVFVRFKGRMESEQRRRFENHGIAQHPARMQKQGPEPQEQTMSGAKVGRSFPRTIENEELVFEKETFRHDRFDPAGAKQRRHDGHQMREQRQ